MGMIPAKMTGRMPFMTSSGFMTPMELMPTEALAVPYALPTHVSAIENIEPIDPKKVEYIGHSSVGV